MNCSVIIDWKSIVAIGSTIAGILLIAKLNPEVLKEVSIHTIDTFKEYAISKYNNR